MVLRNSIILCVFYLTCGCAIAPKNEVGIPVDEISKEIPKELKEKFEIRETPEAPVGVPSGNANVVSKVDPVTEVVPTKAQKISAKKDKKAAAKGSKFPNRRPEKMPFDVGEKQILEVTYLGMAAGTFTMSVLPMKEINNREVYQLQGHARSSDILNFFYSVDDFIESFMDSQSLFSHRFHMKLNQTKQQRDSLELLDSETRRAFYWNRKNHKTRGYSENKEYLDIPEMPQDGLSAIYYVRSLPLEIGKSYRFPVVSEGRAWEAIANVVGTEVVETAALGKVECIKILPQTLFDGVMKQTEGQNFIWLTNDSHRYIAKLEAVVKIGSVLARLKKVE